MAALLHVRVSGDSDAVTVIHCTGEIDLANVVELEQAVAWSMTRDLRVLRIDATGVCVLESIGVRCLLDAAGDCSRLGARFEIIASPQVERTLRICDLYTKADHPVTWAIDGEVIAHRQAAIVESAGLTRPELWV